MGSSVTQAILRLGVARTSSEEGLHTGGNSGSQVNAGSTGLRALLPFHVSLRSIAVTVPAPRLPRRGARDASFLVRKDAEPATMSTIFQQEESSTDHADDHWWVCAKLPLRLSTTYRPHGPPGIPAPMLNDLHELVDWGRGRREALQPSQDASRKTECVTFQGEQRWLEAIRR